MFQGAFVADWYNQEAGSPGFGLEQVIGSTEREVASRTEAVSCNAEAARGVLPELPEPAPVAGEVSIREPAEDTRVIGSLPHDEPIVTLHDYGQGKALYVGCRAGAIYQASWTEGFRDVLETDEKASALDDNAYGYDFRPPAGARLPRSKGAKAWAQMLRGFLRGRGIGENVRVEGYTDGIGVLKVKSFRTEDAYWVGFANRLINPELDFKAVPPEQFHDVLRDLQVRVRLDQDTQPELAWLVPHTSRTGGGWAAMPQMLPLETIQAEGAQWAQFTLPELVDFAAVALMAPGERPAAVGIATDHEALAAGGALTAQGVIINTSAQRIRGTIEPGLEAGLALVGEAQAFDLQPREQATFPFRVSVPEGLAPDYYQMNMVARLEDGREVVSPTAELHVQRDIVVQVANDRTIFPLGDLPPVLPVTVQVNTVEPSDLRATVTAPDGFSAQPSEHKLEALREGQEQTVEFRFSTQDDTPRASEGTLTIAGALRGKPFSRSYPVRLACGAVIYHKTEKYKLGASTPVEPRPLLCLENSKVLATVIEGGGVVHDLVLRETYTDHLVPSEYPFGLVWYGFGGWQVDEMSGCGEGVWARLKSQTRDGHPVSMAYSLEDGDNHLTVAVETGDAGPVPIPFYLMSRIGVDGRAQRTRYPTADGIKDLAWRGGRRTVTPAELSATWLAVQDDASAQTFGCVYDFPSLDHISLAPGDSNFNYMIFYPRADVPIGNLVFYLSATTGDVQKVIELQERLAGQ